MNKDLIIRFSWINIDHEYSTENGSNLIRLNYILQAFTPLLPPYFKALSTRNCKQWTSLIQDSLNNNNTFTHSGQAPTQSQSNLRSHQPAKRLSQERRTFIQSTKLLDQKKHIKPKILQLLRIIFTTQFTALCTNLANHLQSSIPLPRDFD